VIGNCYRVEKDVSISQVYKSGIDKIKELIQERIDYAVDIFVNKKYSIPITNQTPSILSLEDIFDQTATLDRQGNRTQLLIFFS